MALNVTTAVFRPGFNIATASPSLVQWDQGQVLKFEGVELPSAYQVEFTNAVTVQAITMIGNENGVEIPNELLQQSFPITAYIVLHETAEDRETEYWATIYVKARQKPREETPDPEQTSVIDQTIAALQDGVAEAQAAANEAAAASQAVQNMGVEAETLPAGSAATVEKTVDPETGVVTLTYGIPKGGKGDKGDKGNTGETYMLAPSVDTIVKNPNTGTFIPAQIIFTVYKVVNGTSSPYRAADIVADIFGMGMVPHYEVVNDYRLTVPINSIADTGYVACSAYGNGGIIATITIPCILDGAKGDPGEGVAPNGTTGQFLKKKSEADYDTEWADVDPGVTSVNGKTGAVTLTASDVGAKPASYEAPVSSVNEKTGAVVLDAGDIGYDGETTYPDASVGKELGTINSALSSLSAVTEIIDTASGAIASFPDGAGTPMRSLLATIEPEQDLHGQDAPYPAGAGKNKLPLSLANIKTLNTSGTWSGNTYNLNGAFLTVLVDESGNVEGIRTTGQASDEVDFYLYYELLLPAERYTLTGCPSGGSATTYRLFATNIGGDTGSGASGTFDGVKVTTVRINIKSGTNVTGKIFTPMIRLESVTDATFAPYSNVCSVGGWQGLNGEVADINFLNQDGTNTSNGYVNHAYINIFDGAISQASGTWDVMEYVPVKPNTTYTLSGTSVNVSNGWAEYDVNKVQVAHGTASVSPFTFTTGSRTHFVRFNRNYATDTQCQINLGSSALPYVPYETPLPITCTWQTEAGTVYGGTVDVVTGVLTVNRGIIDLSTLTWNRNQPSGATFYRYLATISGATGENNKLVCSDLAIETSTAATGQKNGTIKITSTGEQLVARLDSCETAAAFTTAMSGVMLVYPLATPQTYQLTPQQIETLLGNNTVFVDCGSVSVTYQASIKGYIDKVLAS